MKKHPENKVLKRMQKLQVLLWKKNLDIFLSEKARGRVVCVVCYYLCKAILNTYMLILT